MKIAFKNSKILMINGRTLTPVPGQGPEPGLHYVYTSSEGHGSISASPMSGKKDTLITLSNTPDQNYIFSKYTLNNVDLAGSSFLMPDEDAYVRGYFQPDVRTITVTQPSHGTITAPASAQIGSTVTLSCTPDTGYVLQYFTVNGSQIQGNTFIMPASNVTVSASVAAIEYTISVTQPSHGVITAPGTATYGSTVTLSCTPATGYSLDHFTVDGVQIVGNTFTMPAYDVTIGASVSANTYTISVTQTTGGTITAPQSAQYGSLVILSSTADSGYELQNYTVDGVEIVGNTFTMPAHDVTVSAVFDELPIVLPTNTIRVKYAQGAEPAEGSAYGSRLWDSRTLVDQANNIWDLTRSDGNWEGMFWGSVSNPSQGTVLEVIAANLTNVSNPTTMFAYQGNLTSVRRVTTSSTLTTTSGMFSNCSSLSRVDLFYTGNVTNFSTMFSGCSSLESIPNFDTSNGTNFRRMFENTRISTAPDIDTSKAESLEAMFNGCSRLTAIPQYDATHVTTTEYMFSGCTSLEVANLFDTSSVTKFSYMFSGCSRLKRIPTFTISSGNCYISWMFYNCANVESGMLDLYNQFSQMPPASTYRYQGVFRNCGTNTASGQAEREQIPSDWK